MQLALAQQLVGRFDIRGILAYNIWPAGRLDDVLMSQAICLRTNLVCV